MQISELKKAAEEFVDISVSDELVLNGLREALSWLAVRSYLVDTITKDFEGGKKYQLPKKFLRVIKVEKPKENEIYRHYLIDGNMIRFREDGEYRIYAERAPYYPESVDEYLELHPMLISKMQKYLQGYIMLAKDVNPQYGQQLIHEYFPQEVDLAVTQLKRGQKSPTKWTVKRK